MNRHTTANGCYKRRRKSISSSVSSSSLILLAFAATTAPQLVSGLSTAPALLRSSSSSAPISSPSSSSSSRRGHYIAAAAAFHPPRSFCGGGTRATTSPRHSYYKSSASHLFMSADPVSAAAAASAAARKAAMGTSSSSQAAATAVASQAAAGQAASRSAVVTTIASNIAVSIDRPLMTDGLLPYHSTTTTTSSLASSSSSTSGSGSSNIIASARAVVAQALASLWAKPVVRVALLVLVTGLALNWLGKQQQQQQQQENSAATEDTTESAIGGLEEEESISASFSSAVSKLMHLIKGPFQRVLERFEGQQQDVGVPMPFMDANEGWGVCTLASRKRLGKSSFVQYDFDLPQSDYVLPLDLGQQVSMCCLDNEGNVARGDFFPFVPNNNHGGGGKKSKKKTTGSFSILLPNHKSPDKNIFAMGLDASNFARVVKNELKIGDEVALKPGKRRLAYRGQYLPVTDMVYVAFGTGIVPVLDQIRAVLPTGTSSVKSVTVVWINEATRDFDVTAAILEQEYFKYSQKLAVSCIVDDLHYKDFAENTEVNDAIPNFELGAMAVVAGPAELKDKAMSYLEHERGYPRDTICVL